MFFSRAGASTLRSTLLPFGPRSVTMCFLVSTATTSASTVTCRLTVPPGFAPSGARVAAFRSVRSRIPEPFFLSSRQSA